MASYFSTLWSYYLNFVLYDFSTNWVYHHNMDTLYFKIFFYSKALCDLIDSKPDRIESNYKTFFLNYNFFLLQLFVCFHY